MTSRHSAAITELGVVSTPPATRRRYSSCCERFSFVILFHPSLQHSLSVIAVSASLSSLRVRQLADEAISILILVKQSK